jgi:hypothetical protein
MPSLGNMPFRPKELLDADAEFARVDLQKVRENEHKSVAVSYLHVGRYAARVLLKGELTTDGITFSSHEEYGDKYSFGLRLEDPEDADALVKLLDRDVPDENEDQTEWEVRNPFRDSDTDVLYLKCKTNVKQDGFAFTSNLKLNPKKPCPEVYRYMPVQVEVLVGAYFNVRENVRGICFTVRHIEFSKPTPEGRKVATAAEGVDLTDPSTPSRRGHANHVKNETTSGTVRGGGTRGGGRQTTVR